MKTSVSVIIVSLVYCAFLSQVHCTLSPSDKSKKGAKQKELKVKVGPEQYSVFDRNLIEDEPSPKDILVESGSYYKDTENRLFNGTVLGYVTSVRMMWFVYIVYIPMKQHDKCLLLGLQYENFAHSLSAGRFF